jgi:hypothetical protein
LIYIKKLKDDEIKNKFQFDKLFHIKQIVIKNKDQIWRWKQLKGCLKFWSVSMRIDEARENKGGKNYRCQTRYSLDTCASISWRGHRKLSNIIVKCGVWSLNDVARATRKVWTLVHALMHAILVSATFVFQ